MTSNGAVDREIMRSQGTRWPVSPHHSTLYRSGPDSRRGDMNRLIQRNNLRTQNLYIYRILCVRAETLPRNSGLI